MAWDFLWLPRHPKEEKMQGDWKEKKFQLGCDEDVEKDAVEKKKPQACTSRHLPLPGLCSGCGGGAGREGETILISAFKSE